MSVVRTRARRPRPYLDLKVGGLKVVLQERPRLLANGRFAAAVSGVAVTVLGGVAYWATGWNPFV
ncbi:hypothetical protein OG689_41995 [Kitasatospora sp. NBC_00240]|uniref:hypothetical protein n=1 Tax=Kitasatospora sp. NBC_00240 TaxID=2903567 RepID=UPI002259A369|nr:hypothetical protein [Kitasatospora sp. NBC_00240]MCX5215731.1 hypothetical protein [Kitasatospora sp. NBC_00240]